MMQNPAHWPHARLDLRDTTPKHGRQPHVLLIEDDDPMRTMIAEVLDDQGIRVTQCPDALHWMDLCAGPAVGTEVPVYDLVISDVRMPGVSGLDLIEGLQHAGRGAPTLLITAFGDEATRSRAESLGAWMLDKPFAVDDFLRHVDAALRGESCPVRRDPLGPPRPGSTPSDRDP